MTSTMPPDVRKGFEARERQLRRVARSAKCDLGLRYFDIKAATGRDDAVYQRFQIDTFNHTDMFAIEVKSRQIGASFTLAGDGLFDGMLKGDHTVIATSFNLEESKEKVVYVKKWWESRVRDPWNVPTRAEFGSDGLWRGEQGNRLAEWPELVKANAFHLEWSNGFRFISHPSRPPRGKRASWIGDELAICQGAGAIFTAALPMVTRGRGRNTVRLASTPLGASGQFWDVWSDEKKYKDFRRWAHGWWEIFDLCEKADYAACCRAFADGMDPEEMVRRFGTKMMRTLFDNADLDSFLQEYHLQFLDSLHSFLGIELVKSCHPAYYLTNLDPTEAGDDYIEDQDPDEIERMLERSHVGFKAVCTATNAAKSEEQVNKALEAIRQLAYAVDEGRVGGVLVFAYDCGRTRDAAEIAIYEITGGRYVQRLIVTLRNIEFEHQRLVVRACFEDLPVRRGMFDKNGLGMDLHEWAQKKWGPMKAWGTSFTNAEKNEWATTMKLEMQRRKVTLIPDRDQDSQLQSVQKRAMGSGAGMFQYVVAESVSNVGGGQKVVHHADKFWVNAMVIWMCEEMDRLGHYGPKAGGETQAAGLSAEVDRKMGKRPGGRREGARNLTARGWSGLGGG